MLLLWGRLSHSYSTCKILHSRTWFSDQIVIYTFYYGTTTLSLSILYIQSTVCISHPSVTLPYFGDNPLAGLFSRKSGPEQQSPRSTRVLSLIWVGWAAETLRISSYGSFGFRVGALSRGLQWLWSPWTAGFSF